MRILVLLFCIYTLFIVGGLFFIVALYRKFIPWNKQFKRYENSRKQHVLPRENKLIGKKAPSFMAKSLHLNKMISLQDFIKRDTVLIFVDVHCVYCDNNVEIFLHEVVKYPDIGYVLIMSEDQKIEADTLHQLYNIDVLLINEKVFIEYGIEFYPAFIKINREFIIQHITSIPILSYWQTKAG